MLVTAEQLGFVSAVVESFVLDLSVFELKFPVLFGLQDLKH